MYLSYLINLIGIVIEPEPILHIHRIRKLRRAPKHQGASLLSKMF